MENLGNQLYRIVNGAKGILFDQGELAQLTYGAFDIAARSMQESGKGVKSTVEKGSSLLLTHGR